MSGLYAKIDVAIARDPRMLAAGPLARLLYIQCVLYARENLTDGALHRRILPLVAVDIATPKRYMDKLVAVGALDATEDGWSIPPGVWTRYNPMKSEVDEKRRDEAVRKASYRDRQRRAEMSQRDTGTSRKQPEPEPEPEPEIHTVTDGFDAFWADYPRKVAKAGAHKAWTRLKIADRKAAHAALPSHAALWAKGEARFIPHAASWLNSRRWEDDLTPATNGHARDELILMPDGTRVSRHTLARG